MATLLIVGNSEGQRRCDATCHRATKPECACCCEGKYHGKGDAGALAQIQEDFKDVIGVVKERGRFVVNDQLMTLPFEGLP